MERIQLHPVNPQLRFVRQVAQVLLRDGLVVYPTDSGYSVGCSAESPKAIHRLYALKKPMKKFFMSLLVPNLTVATTYARLDNQAYGIVKPRVPGPFTFILPADHRISRRLDAKRKEIGIRMPNHPFLQALFAEFPHPLLNTAAKLEENQILSDPDSIAELFAHHVDIMVDIGDVAVNPTNIISLVDGEVSVLRGTLNFQA